MDNICSSQSPGFRQKTDPRSTDPLLTPLLTPLLNPYKINGKMKIKNPELSMGPDSSSSINVPYLKLPRWRSRCRFPTPFWVLIWLKDLSRKIQHRISRNISKHDICTRWKIKEARKGFSLLYCLWNEGRLQRRMFNGVGKLYVFLQLHCWAIL